MRVAVVGMAVAVMIVGSVVAVGLAVPIAPTRRGAVIVMVVVHFLILRARGTRCSLHGTS